MLVHIHMHKVFGFLRQGFFHIAWASLYRGRGLFYLCHLSSLDWIMPSIKPRFLLYFEFTLAYGIRTQKSQHSLLNRQHFLLSVLGILIKSHLPN